MKRHGFGFLDVLVSTALLLICFLLVVYGVDAYYKNLHRIQSNHRIEDLLQDELLRAGKQLPYEDKEEPTFSVRYELLEKVEFQGQWIDRVRLIIRDKDNEVQKEYILAWRA